MIFTIIWFMITLACLTPFYFWLDAHKNGKDSRISGRAAKFSGFAAVLAFIIMMGTIFNPASNKSSSQSENTSSVSQTPSSEVSSSESSEGSNTKDTVDGLGLDSKMVTKFNASLEDGLAEDQGYAQRGKTAYRPALFIDSISYDSNRGLHVKVQPQFLQLADTDKDKVASYSQGMASTQLIIIGVEDQTDQTIRTNFYDGGDRIGGSKVTRTSAYAWK